MWGVSSTACESSGEEDRAEIEKIVVVLPLAEGGTNEDRESDGRSTGFMKSSRGSFPVLVPADSTFQISAFHV